MVRVLFVCTGNICRSPTAEGVFRARLAAAGLEDRVCADSAGTHGYHVGEPPDDRSSAAALARGVDISDLRARRVRADDFHRFDLILAMDRGHLRTLAGMAPPTPRADVRLFLDFASRSEGVRDVPDPYYGDGTGFDRVLDMIEDGVDGLIEEVRTLL